MHGGALTAYTRAANTAGGMDFRPPMSLNDPLRAYMAVRGRRE